MATKVRLTRSFGLRKPFLAIGTALFATFGSVAFAPPASAEFVIVGECLLTMGASYSPPATAVPNITGITHISLWNQGSTCVTNYGVVPAYPHGGLGTPPLTGSWGCFTGVANGWFQLILPIPGYPNYTVDATVVNDGGTMHMVATLFTSFDGVGTFVQGPTETASCALGGSISNTTWTGSLVFQDPAPD